MAPSTPPMNGRCAAPAATHAPVNPPVTTRAIRPVGAVRLGVVGNLSTTSSRIANSVRSATAGVEPMRERGRSIFSRPRCTAHAVTAGAVSERSPANTPIRIENRSPLLSTSRHPTPSSFAPSSRPRRRGERRSHRTRPALPAQPTRWRSRSRSWRQPPRLRPRARRWWRQSRSSSP